MTLEVQRDLVKKSADKNYESEILKGSDDDKSLVSKNSALKLRVIEILLAKRNKNKSLQGVGNAIGYDFLFLFHIINILLMITMIIVTIKAEGGEVTNTLELIGLFGGLSIVNLGLSYYARQKIKGSVITSVLSSMLSFNIFLMLATFMVIMYNYKHPFLSMTMKEKRECLEKVIFIENNKDFKIEDLKFD